MRAFLAGASGAIGRPLVRELLAAGHEVTGMTRSPERARELSELGARGVVCDVFDAEALAEAVAQARPEVVVHQLTALPQVLDMRRPDLYEATNRVRTQGTRYLVAAAKQAGARRLVAQSIAFVYASEGGWVKGEEAAVMESAPEPFGGALAATMDLERQVLEPEEFEGLVLRYGFFYGPGTAYAADGHLAGETRRRRMPVVGRGQGTFSFIHVDDAAAATVAACERGERGIYNVVDDDPAPMREWLPAYAEALGAKRPLRVPAWLARVVAGKQAAAMATQTRGASNAKAKRELGWAPSLASWREGFPATLGG